MNKSNNRQFYFSLFRVLAWLRGGDARRAESNGFEAVLVGLMMFAVHYLFFATLIPSRLEPWLTALLLLALAFWVWLFWMLFLYLNSVVIKFLRLGGFFRAVPTRRLQCVFWVIATTAMACALLRSTRWVHEVGAIWLVAVALNLTAAVVLAFSDATRPPGE